MTTYQFTVSPDFSPRHLSGWHIFNTWLQRKTDEHIHLEMYAGFHQQHQAIKEDKVDLIYANPLDAAILVREKNFLPLVKAKNVSDEALIATSVDSGFDSLDDLWPDITIAVTEDSDVRMVGMMLLEAVDLSVDNSRFLECDSYVLVTKQLLQGKADVGVFLASAYDDLTTITKNKLKTLARSEISDIYHTLLLGPKLHAKRQEWQALMVSMNEDAVGLNILQSLGFETWSAVSDEDMEFMIDLMNTLAI